MYSRDKIRPDTVLSKYFGATEKGRPSLILTTDTWIRLTSQGSRWKRGTEVAALFYSLLESARLCGVDPREYLLAATKAVLNAPTAILLPHQFAAQSRTAQPES